MTVFAIARLKSKTSQTKCEGKMKEGWKNEGWQGWMD